MSQDFIIKPQNSIRRFGNDGSSERLLCHAMPSPHLYIQNDTDDVLGQIIRSFHDNSSRSYFHLHRVENFEEYMTEFLVKDPLIRGDSFDYYLSEQDERSIGWGSLSYVIPFDTTDSASLDLHIYLNALHRETEVLTYEIVANIKENRDVKFSTSQMSVTSNNIKHYQPSVEDFINERMPIWFSRFSFEF